MLEIVTFRDMSLDGYFKRATVTSCSLSKHESFCSSCSILAQCLDEDARAASSEVGQLPLWAAQMCVASFQNRSDALTQYLGIGEHGRQQGERAGRRGETLRLTPWTLVFETELCKHGGGGASALKINV